MRYLAAALLLLALNPAHAETPERAAVVDRFLEHCRADEQLDAATRQQVIDTVERLRGDSGTADEAIAAGLMLLSADFAAALEALRNEQPDAAIAGLAALSESGNPFLAAEASFLIARTQTFGEQYEQALPRLVDITEARAEHTVRTGEAWFLRGKAEAALLDRSAAMRSFKRFLAGYPEAPRRLRNEAEAMRLDLVETEFNLLHDIHAKMDFSRRRLRLDDPGDRTQEVQDEVVALLTEMIEDLEKKCGSCSGCKKGGGGGGGMGGSSPGMSSGLSEQPVITERDGQRTPWVDLSKRHEDPTVFSAAKRRLPLQYKDLVEQYYRSFQDGERR